MSNAKFVFLTKGRKYFKAKMNGKYDVKFLIDEKSENLEIGVEHDLAVTDLSVRSKYGTDLMFSLVAENKVEEGVCTIKHQYNEWFVEAARELNGKWDAENKCFVFNKIFEDKIEELDTLYNSNVVAVEITAKDDLCCGRGPVDFCGYVIAKAFGRDSGARLGDGVGMLSGSIDSGGSVKNWSSEVSKGSVFRLKVSKNLIDAHREELEEDWEIKIID